MCPCLRDLSCPVCEGHVEGLIILHTTPSNHARVLCKVARATPPIEWKFQSNGSLPHWGRARQEELKICAPPHFPSPVMLIPYRILEWPRDQGLCTLAKACWNAFGLLPYRATALT